MSKTYKTLYHGMFLVLIIAPLVIIGVIVRNFVIAPGISWHLISTNFTIFLVGAAASRKKHNKSV